MSAFILSNKHIATLINSAGPKFTGDFFSYSWKGEVFHITGNRRKAGQVLMQQNRRSVNVRYGESMRAAKFTEDCDTLADPVVVLKACACYDYQSCETDDYEETEAHAIIQALRKRAITELPGYGEAPWGID